VAVAISGVVGVLSVTAASREKTPAVVGVPLNTPKELNAMPVGSPEVTLQV
jgi:hypothetical protein